MKGSASKRVLAISGLGLCMSLSAIIPSARPELRADQGEGNGGLRKPMPFAGESLKPYTIANWRNSLGAEAGSLVDVVWDFPRGNGQVGHELLLEKVRLKKIKEDPAEGRAMTVLVTEKQRRFLAGALKSGKLRVIIRGDDGGQ